MIKTNQTTKIRSIKKDFFEVDVGSSIKPIFTELCLECKNKGLLWEASPCNGCIDNQVFPGTIRKFRKNYPEYRGRKR